MSADDEAQVEVFDVVGPLDLVATMSVLAQPRRDPSIRIESPTSVALALRSPAGDVATARFVSRRDRLVVTAWGPGAAWLLSRGDRLAGLGDDPASFTTDDPAIAPLARRWAGLRLTAGSTPYDVALRAVFGQRVTGGEATSSWWAFVRRFGETAPGPLELFAPPHPERAAALPVWEWRSLGLEGSRSIAAAALSREASRLASDDGDRERVERRLAALPGIGPWTLGLVRHLAYGDASAVPLGDWHIARDVCFALTGEERGDDARMIELLQRFPGNGGRVWRLVHAAGIHHPRRAPGVRLSPIERWR
jgi:hypothetical protein